MKKFFQNLALAILAIAGVVSSCKIEDIKTTFEPSKATAIITVTAYDALNENADISNDPALNLEVSSTANNVIKVNGNVITIEGGPAIQEQTITINAEYKGSTGQTTEHINSLLAGGNGTYVSSVVVGVAPKDFANAFVQVSVWDNATGKDVTAESEFTPSGAEAYTCRAGEAKGSFVISHRGDISAFTFGVKAKYGTNEAETSIAIGNIAKGTSKTYAATIKVGTVPEPVKDPAVANIRVTAFDALLEKDVTSESVVSAQLATGSKASVEVSGNVVKVTGDSEELKIAAQKVTLTVKYDNREETAEVNLSEIPAGETAEYSTNVIFKNTQVLATAVVQASVWDNATGKDVTASATYSYAGVPEGYTVKAGDAKGSFIITSTNGISAFGFEVTAEFGGASATETVQIGDIASETKTYTVHIEVGTVPENPAIAHIRVNVVDGLTHNDITKDSEITATLDEETTKSTVSVDGNVVTVTAGESLKIENETVTIVAKYNDAEEGKEFVIDEVPANSVGEYAIAIVINDPTKYYITKVNEEVIKTEVGTFYSTHNLHTYTHDYGHDYGHGHDSGKWMYNETEFILETTIDYKAEYGTTGTTEVEFADGHTDADEVMVYKLAKALEAPHGFKDEQLQVKVSAFARYSAYAVKVTTKMVYEIYRYKDDSEPVLVATVTLFSIATYAEYVESSIPGHEGHYVHGHGHADEHGYSSNAGGGIMWDE